MSSKHILNWLSKNAANYNGKGAETANTMGAITIGLNAVSGKDTDYYR